MTEETGISPELFARWLTPSEALEMFRHRDSDHRQRPIADRLCNGLLQAAAAHVVFRNGDRKDLVLMTLKHWEEWSYAYDADFWETGDTNVPMGSSSGYGGGTWGHRFFDVRIDPTGLLAMGGRLPVPAQQTAPPLQIADPLSVGKGGRPPKAFWEPLLIEMARQLYVGDLKPDRQSDIEAAMHDWITANDHSAGETQVRERARALFKSLQV